MAFPKTLLLLAGFIFSGITGMAQSTIEIIHADSFPYSKNSNSYQLIGNVQLKHDGVFINCDRAIRYNETNQVEAFGHIYIFQPDTFDLMGDELKYDGNTKIARISKHVFLSDKQMNLTTESLDYNTQTQTGYYTNNALILNGPNTLTSKKGTYNRRGNIFYFKEKVVLTSPEYTMESDTFQYNAFTKTAYFFGPTVIKSAENTIVCNSGWYNTITEKSQFSHYATIYSKENKISADSILYDRKQGIGKAHGNIEMVDTLEKTTVYGQYGVYNRKTKLTLITKSPMVKRIMDNDSMYILADSLYYFADSFQRSLKTFHHSRILQNDFQGSCDSLLYVFSDSVISMYRDPILWNENNQITGDTVRIYLKNSKISFMKVDGNAFIASLVESERYNQISGKTMDNYFTDNKLRRVKVVGNGESIYYAKENESDSSAYIGINKIVCSEMLISLDSGKVDNIRFYTKPEGTLYPPKQFPAEESKLKGFTWLIKQKPAYSEFEQRMKKVVPVVVKTDPALKPLPVKKKTQTKKAPKKSVK
ncbi:MAG: hypothetical protein H7321_08550 [Bacteroidia bacterium]|nr:hypothetical protein [Bacteroidia bacterium]